tara:strand:- start:15691 stop:15861 length:171 start_codon:yes stop_codon:yes gene_type:complete
MLAKSNERSFNCYAIHVLFNLLRRSKLHFVKNKKLLDFSRSFFVAGVGLEPTIFGL